MLLEIHNSEFTAKNAKKEGMNSVAGGGKGPGKDRRDEETNRKEVVKKRVEGDNPSSTANEGVCHETRVTDEKMTGCRPETEIQRRSQDRDPKRPTQENRISAVTESRDVTRRKRWDRLLVSVERVRNGKQRPS